MASKKMYAETEFPVMRVRTDSAQTSETFGAFGEMELARNGLSKQYPNGDLRQQYSPAIRTDSHGMRRFTADDTVDSVRPERAGSLMASGNGRTTTVYRPTTARSEASAASTRKSYGKLSEVYSNSGDTVEFAHNFTNYLNSVVSPYVWIVLLIILGIWGVVLILVGAFNIPFCPVQPMIPIYLVVAGSLFVVFSAVFIYNLWPMPANARRGSLSAHLACRAIEGFLCLVITVWLILGCIWTYGYRQYVHFEESMFEMYFCDAATYWIAFLNATLHLTLIALMVLAMAIVLALGIWKETDDTPNSV